MGIVKIELYLLLRLTQTTYRLGHLQSPQDEALTNYFFENYDISDSIN
jgi:hypothetical protein